MGQSGGDKTEKPTPKRREEARKKGQVAKSQDLNGAVVLLSSLFALSIWGPHIWQEMGSSMRSTLALIATPEAATGAGLGRVLMEAGRTAVLAVAPIAIVCLVAGVLSNVGQ